ncbi:MAG: hypothetical protein AABY00_00985 [Nanoarchaeota archaeon]
MRFHNKEGAIELSIGTIVIIVLGMTMLILGLILVRQIFSVATKSVDSIDGQIKDEINKQLGSQEGYILVYTGDGKDTAKVKPGSGNFGIAVAARTPDGSATDRNRLQYRLSLAAPTGRSCIDAKVLGDQRTMDLFKTPLNKQNVFDKYEEDKARALIEINVPSGTPECTQKVLIDVTDTKTGQSVGGSGFLLEIVKGGFF